MITIKDVEVTYITEGELSIEARKKPIEEIGWHDVIDWHFVQRSSLLILKKDKKYKVLKSRY